MMAGRYHMNLIIFDIDGTIVDSVKVDDECFIQSFQDLHNIDLTGANWNNFNNVTDSGLTSEIFETHLGRQPSEQELLELKTHFYKLLNHRRNEITEIKGAKDTLASLIKNPEISVAFATGGWKETAELKLLTIGFEINDLILISANEDLNRAVITKLAIEKSLIKEQLVKFDTITYIGDGLWDFKTAEALNINFIGVDSQQNNKLRKVGATKVVTDLTNEQQIIRWAKE